MNATTLNEIASSLLNELRGGRSSNTEHLSLEQIKYNIKYYRTTFIRRDLWRNNNRFRMYEQDLGHLPVETIDSAEDDSITSGNIVMRTTNEVPTPIRAKEFEGITHVSCKDKLYGAIPVIDIQRTEWEQFNKYTNNTAHASYRNGYIYIFNNIALSNIHVRGVFEDPEQVFNMALKEDGTELYDDDEPFPIPMDMIEGIKKGLLNGELKIMSSTPNDEEADMNQSPQVGRQQ